ncbi:hypothetical protein ATN84_03020 [Paramesorhizobium deserti]|uniref:Lytic murein transglycosylase n=1 Tax=Paramesorhizobium deserti TaxID=1494590 RepID=A0A135HZW9_9HYPH|nr:hypothetical protein ATN84_03020 [Paramesorhizobium deserti]
MLPFVTPLCPAGHLPLKGGDHAVIDAWDQSQTSQNEGRGQCQPISPLEGEMAGRAEGGTVPLAFPSEHERFPQ